MHAFTLLILSASFLLIALELSESWKNKAMAVDAPIQMCAIMILMIKNLIRGMVVVERNAWLMNKVEVQQEQNICLCPNIYLCLRGLSLSQGQIFLKFCLSCLGQIFCLSLSLSCPLPALKDRTETGQINFRRNRDRPSVLSRFWETGQRQDRQQKTGTGKH
jgi:hypothetical protein